jgi:cytochrome P450
MFDATSTDYLEDPYRVFRAARDSCPVARTGTGEFVVTGREQITRMLRDPAVFTSRYNLDGMHEFAPEARAILADSLFFRVAMFNVDPPEHAKFRAFFSQFFAPRRLREIEAPIRDSARRLVAGFAAAGAGDLLARYAYPLPMGVIADLIGLPEADRPMIKEWNNAWLGLQVVPLPPEQQVGCARAVRAYEAYVSGLLAKCRVAPGDDLLSAFAAAADEGVCTDDDAVVALRVMIAAGHETTTNLIGNALHQLLREPRRWRALVADPGLAEAAVEEALRFDPSVQAAPRTATADVELGGVRIPAGARVHAMFAATGRDPAVASDPEEFRLDRTGPPRHLGFGYGIHFCVGAQLARLESRIALQVLAEALPDLRLRPGFTPAYVPGGYVFRGLTELPTVWST